MVAGQGLATDGKHGRSRDDLSKPGVIVTTVGGIVIGLALVFAFLNGYNASGSLVATLISTGVVGPRRALLLAAAGNLVGPFLFGVAVAVVVGTGLVDPSGITLASLAAAVTAALAWNALASLLGIPSSSSHALLGGLIGGGIGAAGPAVVQVRAPPVASRPLAPFTPPPANTYGARPVASGGEPLPRSGLGQAAAQGGRPESYTPPGAPMRVPEPHPAAGLGSANYGVPAYPVARPAAPAPVPPPAHATAAPSAAPAAPAHSVSPAARPVQAAHPATPAPAATNTHPQPRQPNPPPPRKNERDEGQQR